MRFLEHRIGDRRMLRLIGKWLNGYGAKDGHGEVPAGFDTWRGLLPYHQSDPLGRTWQEAATSLSKGETGMYLLGTFVVDAIPDDEEVALGTTTVLAFDPAEPTSRTSHAVATDSDTSYFSTDRFYLAAAGPQWGWIDCMDCRTTWPSCA